MIGSQGRPGGDRRAGVRRRRGCLFACVPVTLALVCGSVSAEKNRPGKGPVGPAVRLKLEDLGVPAVSASFLNAGASMLTVNMLDATHLLVTFATRDLVPRIPGDPETDEDRMVAGEVVELPSGKVLARTKWHLHDHGRYLWPLGGGLFAVRIGEDLSIMAPLTRLEGGESFLRQALPHQRGRPMAVQASPDDGLFSVVTELPLPKRDKPVVILGDNDPDADQKHTYAVDFFRVEGDGSAAAPLEVKAAGVVRSPFPALFPMDADGYLWAVDDKPMRWTVTFNDFNGQVLPAGMLDSSCPPRLQLVSRSEYVALTCRGDATRPKLLSMGFDGHETWEEPFGEFAETPSFQFAPAAGRFAMLRTSTVAQSTGDLPPVHPTTTNQEVRVYQTESGDLLLKVSMSPVFRVPENFGLSEDGRALAVIHDDEIQVYTLPAPSKKDLAEQAEVQKFRPPTAGGMVTLGKLTEAPKTEPGSENKTEAELSAPVSATTRAELPVAAAKSEGGADATAPAGGTTAVRKRPTLLNPGEVPEFKDKKAPVQ